MAKPKTYVEARDHAHWEAVEEAGELIEERLFPAALLNLKVVIEKDPNNPYAYHLLGGVFHEIGELEASRDAYGAAVRVAPDHLGARVALSHVLRELGRFDEAEREAKTALRRHPRDGEAMHALGLVQIERGNAADARVNLQGFLDSSPELEAADEVRTILGSLGLDNDNGNDNDNDSGDS